MTSLTGVGQKDADLAIFDAACRSTVLALDPDGFGPLFEKAGLINHQHPTTLAEPASDILAHLITQVLRIPHRPVEQVLHGIGRALACLFGQLPSIFAFERAEQALQVGLSSLACF